VTRRVERRALALVAAAALMTGCGTATGDPDDAVGEPTNPAPATTAETPTPSEEATAETPPAAEEEPVTARPTSLKTRLLPASKLPGFNADFAWRTTSTSAGEGADLGGTCHKFAMTSIGASKVVRRAYAPVVASPSSAGALVAEFPDVKTAKRAYAVLGSWREQCSSHVDAEVGDFTAVPLDPATGGWYLLTAGTTFDAQGFARRGARIAVLTMKTEGQDYAYPAGKEPMAIALKRAAALL